MSRQFVFMLGRFIVLLALGTRADDDHICLLQKAASKLTAPTLEMQIEESTTTTTSPAFCTWVTPSLATKWFENPSIKYQCEGVDLPKYQTGMLFGDGAAFLPLYSSLPLNVTNNKITKLAIWFHGGACDADYYFCEGLSSAEFAKASEDTLVLAPLFFVYKMNGSFWSPSLPPDAVSPCWAPSSGTAYEASLWITGGNSVTMEDKSGGEFTKSSFELIDMLVKSFLTGGDNSMTFPNVEKISLLGFSAGAAILNRWSFLSDMPSIETPLVQVIYGDSTDYLYLDSRRPSLKCRPSFSTGTNHTCDSFTIPGADDCKMYATNPPANTIIAGYGEASIAGYNLWDYSLTFPSAALGGSWKYKYVSDLLSDEGKIEKLLEDFPSKNIKTCNGAEDFCNCGTINYKNAQDSWCYPTVNPPSIPPNNNKPFCTGNTFGGELNGYSCCDTWPDSYEGGAGADEIGNSCAALLEGTNRLQRALNYKSYLESFYASRGVNYSQDMGFFTGQHDSTAFAVSEAVVQWTYGA